MCIRTDIVYGEYNIFYLHVTQLPYALATATREPTIRRSQPDRKAGLIQYRDPSGLLHLTGLHSSVREAGFYFIWGGNS